MNYHYLDTNNQPAGPASLDEIHAMVRDGRIAADPMICPLGSTHWKPLSALDKAIGVKSVSLPFSGTILADFVGRLVKLVGGLLNPALVEKSLSLARHFGQYAVLLGGALGLIAAIVAAARYNSFGLFVGGIAFVLLLAVAQFSAARFLGASDHLIETTPSRLSSLAFLECIGVLAVLGAIGTFLGGLIVAVQASSLSLLIPAILAAVFWAFIGAIALHPKLANVEAGSGSAGEEAIGILAFGLKAVLKLVPLAFALFAIVGALALMVGTVAPNSQMNAVLISIMPPLPVPGLQAPGLAGAGVVVTATLLPMIAYFAYLILSLPLELWRAILSLPGKLEALRRVGSAT